MKNLCLTLALVFALVGCDGDTVTVDNTSPAPDSPTEPVLVLIGGRCRADSGRIECEDSSRSTPAGRLASVQWDLRDAETGLSQDRRQNPPRAEVSFSGLEAGEYEVEQTVLAGDGGSASQVHGGLVITD